MIVAGVRVTQLLSGEPSDPAEQRLAELARDVISDVRGVTLFRGEEQVARCEVRHMSIHWYFNGNEEGFHSYVRDCWDRACADPVRSLSSKQNQVGDVVDPGRWWC